MLYGFDAANLNPQSAFDAALPGAAFLLHKATEGLTFADATYPTRIAQARAQGKLGGSYHFAHPRDSWIAQARWFIATAKPQPGDLLVLDAEVTDTVADPHVRLTAATGRPVVFDRANHRRLFNAALATAAQWAAIGVGILAFRDEVAAETGATIVFYSFPGFIAPLLTAADAPTRARILSLPLWIADPNHLVGSPVTCGWSGWLLQQYGISGGLDADILNGDATTWRANAVPGSTPPAPPTPSGDTDMAYVARNTAGLDQWVIEANTKVHIPDVPTLASLQAKLGAAVPVSPAMLNNWGTPAGGPTPQALTAFHDELKQLEPERLTELGYTADEVHGPQVDQ